MRVVEKEVSGVIAVCGYETVLKDGDVFRFYYRGMPVARHTQDVEVTCLAESRDGIHWTRPQLGLFEVQGTKDNNVVLARHRGCHTPADTVCSPGFGRVPAGE